MNVKARGRYPEALKIGGTTVGVAYWDEFKKPILYVAQGNEFTKVASFNNDAAAQWFIKKIGRALQEAGVPFVEDEKQEENE